MGSILALVGGQYGSEGKGVIANYLANRYGVHIRVGGPNAGHSFYHGDDLFKMQVVPCAWAANRDATLLLGRGMLVDLRQLSKEVQMIVDYEQDIDSIAQRLVIDGGAAVLDARHHSAEGGVDGELHRKIGSTGEGVGAARAARMSRDPNAISFIRKHRNVLIATLGDRQLILGDLIREDTPQLVYDHNIFNGTDILLEGTQGSGLSLIHGPWPYVTSADTNAAQLAADIGIAPRSVDRTMLVVRTFPIRVAGNSGPLEGELTWDQISERVGKPTIEQTTVTKKVRRIGTWDSQLFERAVILNRPTSIALMFADYLDPSVTGATRPSQLTSKIWDFIADIEDVANVSVVLVGTGGPRWSVVDRGYDL